MRYLAVLGVFALVPTFASADPPRIRFEEIGEAAGARFVHSTRSFGDLPKAQVLEMFTDGGAAAAVGDFDSDGFDDLFLTDSDQGKPNHLLWNRFGATGQLRFEDVAVAAGVAGGNDAKSIVADGLWLDFDDDGRLDLLVSRFGTPLLYRNLGPDPDGGAPARFAEVSAAAGLTRFGNTIAAIAFDYDGDGWLDLLFGNYFKPQNLLEPGDPHVLPEDLDNAHNGGGVTLWRNVPAPGSAATGGRAFVETTKEAGLATHTGWSLDVGHGDLDNDGDQDVYVASDYGTDRLYVNRGDGTFEDATERLLGGLDTKKGMNVAMADYDRNGYLDVYVTNITDDYMRECNMLWQNPGLEPGYAGGGPAAGGGGQGTPRFLDVARETGTCDSDWGWGAQFGDFDDDGWQDLFVVAGLRSAGKENYIPVLLEMLITPGVDFSDLNSYPDIGDRSWSGYQPQRLFRNLGDGTFREMAAEAGIDNLLDGRGIGVGDFDRDGRLDLLQANARGPSLLYHNVSEGTGHWIELRLRGAGAAAGSNRDAIGARVTVTGNDGETQMREVDGGNGYAGQASTRLHFGLGTATAVARIEIHWPDGKVETLETRDGKPPVPIDAVSVIAEGAPPELTEAERAQLLQQHRNLGKALYENPATQYDAPAELEQALALAPDSARDRVNLGLALLRAGKTDEGIAQLQRAQEQDPSIPHTWFNLGIAFKRASRYDEAIAQLEGMLERVPDEPVTHYNLGVLYKLQGDVERAVRHFERAAELDPDLTGPHFQLATAYRQAGRADDAAREMATFRELKARRSGDAVQEDLEWSWYSEIYDPVEPEPLAAPTAEVKLEVRTLNDPRTLREIGFQGLVPWEGGGTPAADVLAWSPRYIMALFDPLSEPPTRRGAGLTVDSDVRHVAPGDVDDDGLPEIAVVFADETGLCSAEDFRITPVAPYPLSRPGGGGQDRALFLDYDHDYDLDLLLFGAEPALLRNEGPADAGKGVAWRDRTADFPFEAPAGGGRITAAVRFDAVADTQGMDVAVARESGGGVLFRDRLGGRYDAEPLPELPAGTRELLAADVDHDGWTDLVAGTADSVTVLRNRHRLADHVGFEAVVISEAAGTPMALLDLSNRGAFDLVAGGHVFRDLGGLRYEEVAAPETLKRLAPGITALAAVDVDGDGKGDLIAATDHDAILFFRNVTETANGSLTVTLEGVKNLKLAPGARVEVKAGSLYQKRLYDGVPLVFGLGGHASADAVRITWPNGLIQNETEQAAGTAATYREAQRLSGSCPMIFTWNGEAFQFVTDVLGVAPLGASAGDGEYFPTDHDEAIQVPGEALVPTPEGRYEVRITEELREVAFLDQVRLLAIDHPAGVDVFTNEKFQGPPFPEFRLFGVPRAERRYPVAARDGHGLDVRETLLAKDATYPDGFARDYAGLAELHTLDLDFSDAAGAASAAPDGRAILVLSGWVDWADGSTFLASAQGDGPGLVLPYLQVKDEAGEWVTVIDDMGIPAGKPKTIVVDLTGKWRSASREVRIVTSACVYWDEIFLAESPEAPETHMAQVPALSADLHFRGFSRPVIDPRRKQPERFGYADRRPYTQWNPTPGLYTRYGPVAELLTDVDDRFVVMGSGDEIRLSFDARALPPPPAGWRRDFLLWVDGWAKDADANTAYGQTVGPLPYHGMPQYPYEAPNAYPDDPEHRLYRERYLTRPALRPIRPLTEGTPADPRRERRAEG